LLRSVCDDLWLVDRGSINRFDQDIDAYPAWLTARKSRGGSPGCAIGKPNIQVVRRQLKAQLNQLNRIENEITSLSNAQQALQQQLADNLIYTAENRELLDTTLLQQASYAKKLKQAEDNWMTLSEQIEASQLLVG
jgi:ATP-binding cassette subfamily F protein 3